MKVCTVCKVEKDESEYQRYWHSTQKKFWLRAQCSKCFYLRRKKNKMIEEPIKEEIIQPEPIVEEIEVLEEEEAGVDESMELEFKLCSVCDEYKSLNLYGTYTRSGNYRKRCKECDREYENRKYRQKTIDNGGTSRVCPKPGIFNDAMQKQQTFEFLEALGWIYDAQKNIWNKPGLKEDGKFINIVLKPKPPRFRSHREKRKVGRKLNPAWSKRDEIVKLRFEGATIEQIATIYNISSPTVRQILYK